MEMTKQEILRNWEEAKDKREQIKILADLNCTDTGTIRDILLEMGVDYRRLPRGKEKAAAPAAEKATAPETKKAAPPAKQNKPTVESRHKHELRRMGELFSAIFATEMNDDLPDEDWLSEFTVLWATYYTKRCPGEEDQ